MTEELVSFKTAKLAKEKGFDIPTEAAYIGGIKFLHKEDYSYENWNRSKWVFDKNGYECFGCKLDNEEWFEAQSAPTQSLLQKWIREKHNIDIIIKPSYSGYYAILEYDLPNKSGSKVLELLTTYEQALEEGLYQALKLI